MEFLTVTRVKEDFITLCRPASCVENLIDDFVGPLLPHIAGDSERFCHLLRQRFDDTRKRKLNNSLLAIRKAASEEEQGVFTKLTEDARVQLRMLCVFLAALNLELSGSPRYFDVPLFFAVYPELVVAPESDVADLLRFRNYMAGERAFQPKKVEVGKSLKMCISLAQGSDKKYSTGGGVPKMERVNLPVGIAQWTGWLVASSSSTARPALLRDPDPRETVRAPQAALSPASAPSARLRRGTPTA
jgi:hypothetical protein